VSQTTTLTPGWSGDGDLDVEQGDGNDGVVESVLDVPADAINATTGTGENLGWFGEIDRQLDYRTLTGEMDADSDEWAEPTEETTGISGAFHATAGQTAAAGEDAADAANDVAQFGFAQLFENPALLALAALVSAYVLGQLFDINLGGSST
jgi:hypothetical protein